MKPKYKYNDTVAFTVEGTTRVGTIFIIDKDGTWEQPQEVSYDILVESEDCLYKHVPEHLVQPHSSLPIGENECQK